MRDHLAAEIKAAGGYVSFERYMELALYAPGLGYYSGGAVKLGPEGDFITAPELSRLFGSCLALQCAEVLETLKQGSILEIGAGSGRLALDVLSRLETLGRLPQKYYILEVSADLKERQQRLLETAGTAYLDRVEWLQAPPREPFEGLIIANEVLDALPVSRFRWHPDRVEEVGVEIKDGSLAMSERPADARLTERVSQLKRLGGDWQDGYTSEFCPRLEPWALEVSRSLSRGVVLWIDYGLPRSQYYLPERADGTLLCHLRHRAYHDPLLAPGLADITAWVDFTALAEASRAGGFQLAGFATQAHFLAGCGIDREMQYLSGGNDKRQARLANEARQLMLPGEMGERFKVMAWSRHYEAALRGFGFADLAHSL